MRRPISARRLHRRRVEIDDASFPGASLFPFFSPDGRTRASLLVPGRGSELFFVPPVPSWVPAWGAIQIRVARATLRPAEESTAARFGHLWHFDPWWILREPRFENRPAASLLQTTNAVGRFTRRVRDLFFDPDLGAVRGYRVPGEVAWRSDRFDLLLPPRAPSAPNVPSARGRSTWILEPLWSGGRLRL